VGRWRGGQLRAIIITIEIEEKYCEEKREETSLSSQSSDDFPSTSETISD
jgi:hypothetical protein